MKFQAAVKKAVFHERMQTIKQLAALGRKPGANVTLVPEEQYIQEVLAGGPAHDDEFDLPFLTDKERKNARLQPASQPNDTRKILIDHKGHPYTTKTDIDIYGVDAAGHLYVAQREEQGADGFYRTRGHKTLFAGKAGKCFGEIRIIKGIITEINNRSGHYMPPKEALTAILCILMDCAREPLTAHIYQNNAIKKSTSITELKQIIES